MCVSERPLYHALTIIMKDDGKIGSNVVDEVDVAALESSYVTSASPAKIAFIKSRLHTSSICSQHVYVLPPFGKNKYCTLMSHSHSYLIL